MRELELFSRALGLREPWRVVETSFDAGQRRLDLRLDFEPGARFGCPVCERSGCAVHDTSEKSWRHLDFFQHQAYLTARVPRVRCPEHGVHQVELAWAREGSGFTLLFEALLMALVAEMPVRAVAELVGEHDTRVWRVVHHYVDAARAREDLSTVERVGIDETSFRRGQDYVTLFADLDRSRCVFATPGRDADSVTRFVADLRAHGGEPDQVTEVCQDMSEPYLLGVLGNLLQAAITFDRYHVKAQLSRAVDEVRRQERKAQAGLPVAAQPGEAVGEAARPAGRAVVSAAEDRPRLQVGAQVRRRLRADRSGGGALPARLGARRRPLAPATDHRLRPPRPRALDGNPPLVPKPRLQRAARRAQLARAGRQTPRPRLPLNP